MMELRNTLIKFDQKALFKEGSLNEILEKTANDHWRENHENVKIVGFKTSFL